MTFIGISAPQTATSRVRLDLRAGLLAPRIIDRRPRSACVALVATGALLLGGDQVTVNVSVGAGCTLELTDIGGTVAYDADGEESFWEVHVTLGEDAQLFWNAKPLIVATGANVHRTVTVDLGDSAIALLRENIVLGRQGETGGRLNSVTIARTSSRPVFVERLNLDAARPMPGILGSHRVLDSILALGFRPDAPHALQMEEPGALARFLGAETHLSHIAKVWEDWKQDALSTPGQGLHDVVTPANQHTH